MRINNKIFSLLSGSLFGNVILFFASIFVIYKAIYLMFPILQVLSWDISFCDSSSPFAEALVDLYYVIWYVLIIVLVGVIYILVRIITLFTWNLNFINSTFMRDVSSSIIRLYFNAVFAFKDYFNKFNVLPIISNLNKKENKKNILNLWYDRKQKFLRVQNASEYRQLEAAWCVTPSFALMSIGNPTFGLIFSLDSTMDPVVTLQIIGHQWYWSYKYEVTLYVPKGSELYHSTDKYRFYKAWQDKFFPSLNGNELVELHLGLLNVPQPTAEDYNELMQGLMKLKSVVHYTIEFDSTMVATEDLNEGDNRLYAVTEPIVLPVGVPIKVLITSADVLHSWSLPAMGIKVDAVPGRINQFIFEAKYPGTFKGQCSELCGTMHAFMPIIAHFVSVKDFEEWVIQKGTLN